MKSSSDKLVLLFTAVGAMKKYRTFSRTEIEKNIVVSERHFAYEFACKSISSIVLPCNILSLKIAEREEKL